jgi:hypothetical protein
MSVIPATATVARLELALDLQAGLLRSDKKGFSN